MPFVKPATSPAPSSSMPSAQDEAALSSQPPPSGQVEPTLVGGPAGFLQRKQQSGAQRDARILSAALRRVGAGFGADEVAVFEVLSHRTPAQLAEASRAYTAEVGRPLMADLEAGLGSAERTRARGLIAGDTVQLHVETLRKHTLAALGTPADLVIRTLEGLLGDVLTQVRECFAVQLGRSLESAVLEIAVGVKRDEAMAFLQGRRDMAYAARLDGALALAWRAGEALAVIEGADGAALARLAAAYEARVGRTLRSDVAAKLTGPERDVAGALLSGDRLGADVARLQKALAVGSSSAERGPSAALALLVGCPVEQRAILAQAYATKCGLALRAEAAARFGEACAARVARVLADDLEEVDQVSVALEGWSAAPATIHRLLQGRSLEQLAALKAAFLRRERRPLEEEVQARLTGRDEFEVLLALEGPPATAQAQLAREQRRRDLERRGFITFAGRLVLDVVSGDGRGAEARPSASEQT
jgi:hypothetical protein